MLRQLLVSVTATVVFPSHEPAAYQIISSTAGSFWRQNFATVCPATMSQHVNISGGRTGGEKNNGCHIGEGLSQKHT